MKKKFTRFWRVIFESNYTFEVVSSLCGEGSGAALKSKSRTAVSRAADTSYFILAPLTEASLNSNQLVLDQCDQGGQCDSSSVVGRVMTRVRRCGATLVTGTWLAGGNARVIFFDLKASAWAYGPCQRELYQGSSVELPEDEESGQAAVFGYLVAHFLGEYKKEVAGRRRCKVVAHFHDWSASVALILLRQRNAGVATVLTSHGTRLGHHLCANYADFYNEIQSLDFDAEARNLGLQRGYLMEKVMVDAAHVLTSVSHTATLEAVHILKRRPDYVTFNGLDLSSCPAADQLEQRHLVAKARIERFVRTQLKEGVDFDLSLTKFFVMVGRHQFVHEGADLFVESLARLNHKLRVTQSRETVLVFFVFPNDQEDQKDQKEGPVVSHLQRCQLLNQSHDRVRTLLVPAWKLVTEEQGWSDLNQFLIGCHLGVQPSFYEPWGHAAAQCVAQGLPTVTTNCSGFGRFFEDLLEDGAQLHQHGVFVVDRRYLSVEESVCQLSDWMLHLTRLEPQRCRTLRRKVRALAASLDWNVLYDYYLQARQTAIERCDLDGFQQRL